jgi:hypothetical protein
MAAGKATSRKKISFIRHEVFCFCFSQNIPVLVKIFPVFPYFPTQRPISSKRFHVSTLRYDSNKKFSDKFSFWGFPFDFSQ